MQLRIDQAGLAAGTPGRSRTDGLATGALVTLRNTGSGSTTLFRLLWVPPGDTTAVVSLVATGDPKVWTFSPTAARYGSYLIELIEDEGRSTERREQRVFVVRTPNGLIIPALNELADPLASLLNQNVADSINNATDFVDANLNAVAYAGWWRAWAEMANNVGSSIGRFGVEADTVAFYPLDRSLVDLGPNAYHAVATVGMARYSPMAPGLWGLDRIRASGGIDVVRTTVGATPALVMPGELTVEFLYHRYDNASLTSPRILYFGTNVTGAAANNIQWELQFHLTTNDFVWKQQNGTTVDVTYTVNGFLPGWGVTHVAATRTAGQVVQLYLDGLPCGAPSAPLAAPTGGANGWLNFISNQVPISMISQVRISNTAHSAAKILADRNATLGRLFGRVG